MVAAFLSQLLLPLAIADYWQVQVRDASFAEIRTWPVSCESSVGYSESRPRGGSLDYWNHDILSPCENVPNRVYSGGYGLPSGYEALMPYDCGYRYIEDEQDGQSRYTSAYRTYSLWDFNDGLLNGWLVDNGYFGDVFVRIKYEVFAASLYGQGDLITEGWMPSYILFPDAFSRISGWSENIPLFPASAVGLNNGNVIIKVYLDTYLENVAP